MGAHSLTHLLKIFSLKNSFTCETIFNIPLVNLNILGFNLIQGTNKDNNVLKKFGKKYNFC